MLAPFVVERRNGKIRYLHIYMYVALLYSLEDHCTLGNQGIIYKNIINRTELNICSVYLPFTGNFSVYLRIIGLNTKLIINIWYPSGGIFWLSGALILYILKRGS